LVIPHCGIGGIGLHSHECKPMLLGVLILLAFERQVAAQIFNRRRRPLNSFSPCVERLLQTIKVLQPQLCLRKYLPELGVAWSDRENPPTQLNNRWFILGLFGCFKLRSQLPNLLVHGSSRYQGTSAQQKKNICNRTGQATPL